MVCNHLQLNRHFSICLSAPSDYGVSMESSPQRADGLSLCSWTFCPCSLKISLWRVCLWEEVNFKAAAWSVHRRKCWRKNKLVSNQMQCWCLSSSREMLSPQYKPHPVHPEEPAVPISLNHPGLDRIHALPVRLGITTLWARCMAIIEMGTLPTPTLGWTRDKHNVLDGWHHVPLSWTALCRPLCDCSRMELHTLPRMEKVEVVLESLCGALEAIWMNMTWNRAIAIQVHTPKLSHSEMLHLMTACPCCSFQVCVHISHK